VVRKLNKWNGAGLLLVKASYLFLNKTVLKTTVTHCRTIEDAWPSVLETQNQRTGWLDCKNSTDLGDSNLYYFSHDRMEQQRGHLSNGALAGSKG
jgi:hypothetical protein